MPRRKLSKVVDPTGEQNPLKRICTEVPLILQLNDDCLWCIFSYLDLPELLIAGNVCQRFEGIAQMFYRNYQSVNFQELFNTFSKKGIRPPRISKIFRQLQPHLIAMKIHGLDGLDSLDYETTRGSYRISRSIFSNLQHLFLGNTQRIHEKYAKIFPALKQIVLDDITFHYYYDESVASRWFKNSPYLKILKFISVSSWTGECFVGLEGIEELSIIECDDIHEDIFEQFCQKNLQLKKITFDIYPTKDPPDDQCRRINNDKFLKIITKYLKNLESLAIIDSYCEFVTDITDYSNLRDLPKVTKLSLQIPNEKQRYPYLNLLEHFATNNKIEYLNLYYVTEGALQRLQQFHYLKVLKLQDPYNSYQEFSYLSYITSCIGTLEELHIVYYDFKSSARLKQFIQQCKSLRLLSVCGSFYLTSTVLMEIEEFLHNRSRMLELVANETPLAKELLKEPKSDLLTNFLDRTKEKLKLTIDAFNRNGTRKKSFHEWEDWENDNY